jgi:quercetin dioxygenase-like cupin family protein
MTRLIISSLLLLIVSCSGSKEKLLLPEEVSPDVYKVLLDNDDVKVLEVTFEPGQSDNMHDHYPVTFYLLQGGKAQVSLPDGTVNEREIPTGFTGHHTEKVRHQVKNIGDNTIKILLVERKNTHTVTETDEKLILPEEVSPDVYQVIFENDDVKVLDVTFVPGQGDNIHEHGVITYYGIKGGKLENTLPDGTINEMEVPDGFVGHGNAIVKHQMENVGDDTVRVLIVEHKKLRPVKE